MAGFFKRRFSGITQRVAAVVKGVRERIGVSVSRLLNRVNRETQAPQPVRNVNIPAKESTRIDSNLAAQLELNKASAGLPAEWTRAEVQVFYAATQKAWDKPSVAIQERNRTILEYYGQTDLREFVNEVLRRNCLAVQIAGGEIQPEYLTSEEAREFYEAAERDVEESDYTLMIANVIRFNANDFDTPKSER